MRRLFSISYIVLLGWALIGADASLAQEPPSEDNLPEDVPETPMTKASLPQPTFIPAAPYPPEALKAGLGSDVLLQLTVSEEGTVTDAEIAETGGEEFDKAALQIAPSFIFSPALDDKGRPQTARILYRYTFQIEAAPIIHVQGIVLAAGIRKPVAGARLQVQRDGLPTRYAETDTNGAFRFADLDPGEWTLSATLDGFQPEIVQIEVRADAVTQVKLYPVQDRPWLDSDVNATIEVVAQRVAPEITERVLSAEDIRYLPGTNGDVVRAIQNLPGIARPPLNIGQLIIRGTSPEDSRYYLDGMKIPIVFHFSGLSTVINGDSIQEVAFLPGNYGARYGRSLGGAVDIRVKSALPERSNGYASIDLFQATAFVEQRIGQNTALTISGRRSYFDAILNPILNGMGDVKVQAPRYYDFQTRVLHTSKKLGTFDMFFLASDDRFRFLGPAEENEDGEEERTVAAGLTTAFQKARLLWTQELKKGWRSETALIIGPERQTFEFGGTGEAYEKNLGAAFRQELYRGVPGGQRLGWRLGLDVLGGQERYLYDVPVGPAAGADADAPEQGESWYLAPAAYVEPTIRFGPVDLRAGIRLDGWVLEQGIASYTLDPRFGLKWEATPSTTLKASVGKFSQFPSIRQALNVADKTDRLKPQYSIQSSLGFEQRILPELSVETTLFYNHLTQLVVGREDAFRFFSGPPPVGPFDTEPYANEGIGRVYGLELLVKLQTDRVVALLSTTFGNSSRVDREGDVTELFPYDQPFVVNVLGSYKLPKRWRIGARLRVSAGNPYTPVNNRVYNLNQRTFIPVYGERDSARLPAFWSIDIRFDKDYVFRKWTLTTYLDLQNAANTQNVEVMGWTYDFGEEDVVTSIPITPAFGFRGEW